VRACIVSPSVGVLRPFPEGLSIAGEAEFSANSLARGGVLFHFGVLLGREGERCECLFV
jgi:hypothetical protein